MDLGFSSSKPHLGVSKHSPGHRGASTFPPASVKAASRGPPSLTRGGNSAEAVRDPSGTGGGGGGCDTQNTV